MEERKWRYMIYQEDIDDMVSMYNKGKSMQEISSTLTVPYGHVKSIIKRETGNYTDLHPTFLMKKRKEEEELQKKKAMEKLKKQNSDREFTRKQVVDMYKDGFSIKEIISKTQSLTKTEIETILYENHLIECPDYIKKQVPKKMNSMTVGDIHIGDKFKIKFGIPSTKIVTVKKIYPNIVYTDKGCFRIADIIIGEKV